MQSSYWECFKSDISRLWQEKKLQIKKTQKKAEKHFLFQKKSDAYDRHYYNYFTFEIYDFLEEKFWGNFRSLTISRIHLLTLFALSPHFYLEEGLKKWKKPQFALNRKRIEMRFHILSMFNIWWFSGWFPWNTENCDGLRRSVKRYLFTSVTHTGQTYVFKIANFHRWNIVMSKNFKIIHFSFGAISWKLSEKFENVKQKNVIRNFDHVSWEKTFLSPDLGYTYLPMTVCLIKLKERKRLSSDEMLTVCTYVHIVHTLIVRKVC